MDRMEKQCKVTKTIPILSTVNHFLQQQYDTFENESPNFVSKGGVTKDLKYAWIVNGPKFQVIEVQSGSRVASWLFDGILRDKRSRITCVAELPNNNGSPPLFVIGLDCETSGGMIYIFNIMGSKIMRAIQLDDRVCNLHIIDSGDNIPGILKNLDGIIAIGTCGGDTFLIDLCKQMWITENIFDEINYSKLLKRPCNRINLGALESYRSHAIQNNDHLALQLNVSTNSLFLLSTPQGTDALQLPRDNVRISSFLYVPKLISILVGYNFGAWQIYNLLTLELEYTSPVYDEIVPVSHFAYQEPSDDPRAFCYVWAVYSNDIESKHASVPLAAMYALAYESKDNIEFYGTLYQNFMSCSLRFQMDLLPINNGAQNAKGGHCISLQTCMINSLNHVDNSCDHNLTLCMIVWSVWSEYDNEPNIVMAIIDLDQWYKEQMPATIRNHGNECYIAQFDLSRILNIDDSLSIFDVNIDSTSINPFTTVQRLEEHYYPTALTFDFVVMQKSEFTFIKNNGLQRTLLLALEKNGVNSFLNAQSLARKCFEAGLHSTCSSDILSPKLKSQHISSPHTHLLSLALEYNLIGLLTSCAEEWATGAYASAGCTLGVFVEWATQRSEVLQQKANELCVSLFDYSDINLDCNARKILDQCAIQMHHLSSVFKLIKKNCTEYLNSNATIEINEQLRAIQMFSDRLEVLQWLLNVGLLPEAPIQSYDSIAANERMRAPYPIEELYKIYNERRSQLNEDPNPTRAKNKSCELLFIDNLIEYECGGERLRNEWRCDTNINGLYPPPSIQALLRTYLIDNVDLKFKHTILVYVFLDLAVTLDQMKYESIITHLIKFPAVFRLSPCHIKMTQAFWQLDHGDFTTGMEQLLDPLIGGGTTQDEFKPWQHRTVLRALLANKQHKYAALYIQIRQPPFTDLDEIVNAMHLLLSNNMLHAAFEFQRRHQTVHNKSHLLEKFFEGCLQENLITSALKLSLSQDEEDSLIKMLKRQNKDDIHLQLIYYLQRSRGFDVLRVGDQYYHDHQRGIRGTKMGLIGQNSLQLPQILLSTYASVMPSITKKIYDDFRTEIVEQKLQIRNKVQAPTPMSVKIKESNKTIKYKSNTIVNSINKIREIWSLADAFSDNKCLESTPFLCTPKRKIHECQSVTPVTFPKVTYQNQEKNLKKRATDDNFDDELTLQEQNPSKRFRFSSNDTMSDVRLITSSSSLAGIQKQNHTAPEKLLLTPIVKRKYSESPKSLASGSSNLPSILKIRHTNVKTNSTRGRSITPQLEECVDSSSEESSSIKSSPIKENKYPSDNQLHEHIESIEEEEKSCTSSKLGATPRKNLIRTPRPVVHFEDASPSEAIIQTSETATDDSPSKKIETRLSKKNNSLVDASNIHFQSQESKLREEEMKSVARKLSRSSASPYKSIKPRKSLQRTVLESSLVKNITPVLKRSKRIANRRASSDVGNSDHETIETDNESFEKNVTICSSPTFIEDNSPSPKKLSKRTIEDNSPSPGKSSRHKLKNENFVEIMEEKYGHATGSSFSSDNNSSNDSVMINTNLIDNDNSNVTDSFINRMNKKYSKNISVSSDDSEDLENLSIGKPKQIITIIGDLIAETKEDEKNDEISLSFSTSKEVIVTNTTVTNTNILEATEDSIVTDSFIERMEAKFKENNPNNSTIDFDESSLEISKTITRTQGDSLVTTNLKKEQTEERTERRKEQTESCITTNSKIIVNDKMSKSTETNNRKSLFEPQRDDSVVTESFLERMTAKYACEEDVSSFEEISFECPKPIPKILGEMIAETVEPKQVDIKMEGIITKASNENQTSHEIKSNLYADDDSLVTESFIQRMENKYESCESSVSNVSVANSTSIYNSIDANKNSDLLSSKETSSVYCSVEESVENNKNSVEDALVSDDDYSFRMDVDDDEDEDEGQDQDNSISSKESSKHDITDDSESDIEVEKSEEDSSDHEKEFQQDPNEIVEISSDEDENNVGSSNNETEESSEFEEKNSSDSSNSSLSNSQDNEMKENDKIGFNKCIVFEKNSSDHDSNENVTAVESINEIIEISELTEEEEACNVYEDLDVEAVVEIQEDNEENKDEDNQTDKETEVIEILAAQQELESETQSQENNNAIESIEIPAAQQELDHEIHSQETNKPVGTDEISQNELLDDSIEISVAQQKLESGIQCQETNKAIETTEIQQKDLKIPEESEKLIEALATNENQQQIENQNNSNENLLINTNSDVHDEQNLQKITEIENQENNKKIVHQQEMLKLKIQETNITTTTGNESESQNKEVLTTTESTKEIDETRTNLEQSEKVSALNKINETDENQSEKENIEEIVTVKPRRRTRQSSVDSYKSETPLPVVKKPTSRTRRATSIDISSPSSTITTNANTPEKRVTRSSSDMNVSLNQSKVINSKSIGTTRRQSLRSSHSKDDDADKSILEEYSTSRRLTRKQKTMLEKTMSGKTELPKVLSKKIEHNDSDENSDNSDEDEMRGPNIEKIDPIKLLDKQSFEGPEDPEEQKLLLQRSPASSIKTTSSFQSIDNTESRSIIRNLRSRSIDFDIPSETNKFKIKSSSSSDIVGVTTPKRRVSRRLSQLSLNQTPEKDEVASESGIQISTRSKNHIAKLKDLSPDVKRSPRRSSRLSSPQLTPLAEHKGPSTSIKSTRRSILQSDLPIISEESVEQGTTTKKRKEIAEHVDSPAKRNRSKSSDVGKTSIKEEIKPVTANRRKKL